MHWEWCISPTTLRSLSPYPRCFLNAIDASVLKLNMCISKSIASHLTGLHVLQTCQLICYLGAHPSSSNGSSVGICACICCYVHKASLQVYLRKLSCTDCLEMLLVTCGGIARCLTCTTVECCCLALISATDIVMATHCTMVVLFLAGLLLWWRE